MIWFDFVFGGHCLLWELTMEYDFILEKVSQIGIRDIELPSD